MLRAMRRELETGLLRIPVIVIAQSGMVII